MAKIIRMRGHQSLDDLTIDLLMRLRIVCRIIEHAHSCIVTVPSHICILIQISSPNCFLCPILARENPGRFLESSARGNLFFLS